LGREACVRGYGSTVTGDAACGSDNGDNSFAAICIHGGIPTCCSDAFGERDDSFGDRSAALHVHWVTEIPERW